MGGEKGATGKNLLENQKQMTDQSSATLGDTDYRGERTLIHMFPIIKVPPEKWMFLNFKSPENNGGGMQPRESHLSQLISYGPGV